MLTGDYIPQLIETLSRGSKDGMSSSLQITLQCYGCNKARSGAEPHSGEGCHSDGSSHVVGEVEEGCAVGDHARVVEGNAVGNGSHAVLTHTVSQVLLLILVLLEVTVHLHQGHVGGRQVCSKQGSAARQF